MNRLGQHFLKNNSAIKEIIDALDLGSGDRVIEIGAGHGELTEVLGDRCEVIAIEKDSRLVSLLNKKFYGKKIQIIEGDALKLLPQIINTYNLKTKTYKLVGNIPYYITGKLFRILSELKNKPEVSVLTIQKEVAERICAKPRGTNPPTSRGGGMNRLSAIVQFWAEPKIVRIIPRKDFYPEPEVDSAIIKLKVKSEKLKVPESEYYKTVKLLFAQPRKTILNNLLSKNAAGSDKNREGVARLLKKMKIDPTDRPQNLNIEDIERISSVFRGDNEQ